MEFGGRWIIRHMRWLRHVGAALATSGSLLSGGMWAFFATGPANPSPAIMQATTVMTATAFAVSLLRVMGVNLLERHKDALRAFVDGASRESLGIWAYDAVLARPWAPDFSLIWILGYAAYDQGLPPPDEWAATGPLSEETADHLLNACEEALEFVDMDVLPLTRSRRRSRLLRARIAAGGTLREWQGHVATRRGATDRALQFFSAAGTHYFAAKMPEHAAMMQCNRAATLVFELESPDAALEVLSALLDEPSHSEVIHRYVEFLTIICDHQKGNADAERRMQTLRARGPLLLRASRGYQRELPWAARRSHGAMERRHMRVTVEGSIAFTGFGADRPHDVHGGQFRAAVSRDTLRAIDGAERVNDWPGVRPTSGGLFFQARREEAAGNNDAARELLTRAYEEALETGDAVGAAGASRELVRNGLVANDRAAAYLWVRRTIDMHEDRRMRVLDVEMRQALASDAFEEAVGLLLDPDYPVPGVEQPAVEAFQVVEQARSRALLELLSEAPGVVEGGRPLAYEELKALVSEASVEAVGRCVLVEYFMTTDHIYVFVVRADRPEPAVSRIRRTPRLDQAVRMPFAYNTPEPGDLDQRAWAEALQPLVAPVTEHSDPGDRLWIVPHRSLHDLPLHAVPLPESTLAERNPVSYSLSASLMRHCRQAAPRHSGRALVLADPRAADPPLPHARGESVAIAAARPAGTTELYMGASATRMTLLGRLAAAEYDVVHIACHAEYKWDRPLDSGVKLADGDVLTVSDILRIPHLAKVGMVTLSGCETGLARRRGNDEHLGLTSAIIQAGTPAVLVALWSVDDIATGLLMSSFYQHLAEGASRAEALRRAQSRVREATLADIIEHCRFLASLDHAPTLDIQRSVVLLRWLAAGDKRKAGEELADIVERLGPNAAAREKLRAYARLLANEEPPAQPPDYSRRTFEHPSYWAGFKLVGDTR
ncbi:CHAT domain-containing protein [Streptomyces sp. NBC_01102]|uniref:CHAT domain-containing protein n=1 Tax=Streptomyces sp. NBC_01102 TaxID=2903749 RepID=UPI00386D5BC6|nr:CHAT domain-containing protein [Streptomyces sp. NBC_01102]